MEPELFDDLARIEARHWWFRSRLDASLAVLEHAGLPRPARVLDLGAGTGGTTEALAALGPVEALEVHPDALRHLRRRTLAGLYTQPLAELGLPDASYDLVTAFDVLEHLDDDAATIREVARLLRPGGAFLATVPAHPRLASRHDELHHHRRRYTRAALLASFAGSGLEVTLYPWLSLLLPALVASRAWLRLCPPRSQRLRVPPGPANRALLAVTSLETRWLRRGIAPPFGGSWIALAMRRATRRGGVSPPAA
ncbi:MAG: class I SAM-dependent methyltransferase [Alphaproteobacteria bacterium]|nr:class I SAM-dependent methyltransferase [Alphaproteobacteria bacterium]